MQDRRVLFLVSGRTTPSTRFRILPYLPRLAQRGIRCDVAASYPEKYHSLRAIGWRASQKLKRLTRHRHLLQARLRRYDAIVIERELFDDPTTDFEERFRKLTGRMILDVDDAIFLRYPEKFAALCGLCDHVLAGNRLLAEAATKHSRRVSLLPTCIDLREYPLQSPIEPTAPIIGWIGTPSNLSALQLIVPALKELATRRQFMLRIVSGPVADFRERFPEEIPVEFRAWRAGQEPAEIASFDVGIMPLVDEEWERHKCGFKLLQYMASGRAAVASPVGVNAEIINSGTNGLLATSTKDWVSALLYLLDDTDLRARMGRAARQTVEEDFSIDGHVEMLVRTLFPDSNYRT